MVDVVVGAGGGGVVAGFDSVAGVKLALVCGVAEGADVVVGGVAALVVQPAKKTAANTRDRRRTHKG